MEVAKIFAKNVRVRMEELDLTHAQLAARLGISAPNVTATLTNETAPRIDTLIKWAQALETTPQRLLGTETMKEPPRMESLSMDQLEAIRLIFTASKGKLRSVLTILKAKSSVDEAKSDLG